MNKKMIILIITLVIIIIPNKIKAYELETESGYEYSKTLPESGYTYHHTECNGTKVKEENVTYNEEAKTFNINGITEQNNCKFYFNKNGEEIIRTYEVQVTVLNGTIEGETRKVVRSNENTTFSLNPTDGYGNPTVTCTNNQTGSITNNTLTVSNVTNDTTCTVEYSKLPTYMITMVYNKFTCVIDLPTSFEVVAGEELEFDIITGLMDLAGNTTFSCLNGAIPSINVYNFTNGNIKIKNINSDDTCTLTYNGSERC